MTALPSDDYVIRAIRADEWQNVKRLRLVALQDPVAHLAFLESYETAAARPDVFWQDRAQGSIGETDGARQIIAEAPDGTWAGSVTVLIEEAGSIDWAGHSVDQRQGHVVGVFVRPEHRGNGLIKRLFDAALDWAWGHGAERTRLLVHEDNGRAQAAYRKVGFVPSGATVVFEKDAGQRELEFVVERG
ncbi:GNAT family N-acetyltransferase [Streptomyces sp. NPDC026672]|uniref:GNAT family N-acetyltransferase n=1 Tax=Actinomycetes TaxID=1760 RepID=UPI0033CCC40F